MKSIIAATIFATAAAVSRQEQGLDAETTLAMGRQRHLRKPRKGSNTNLVALIERLNDDVDILGTVTIAHNFDTSILATLDMNTVSVSNGHVVITEGTTCDQTSSDFSEIPTGSVDWNVDAVFTSIGDSGGISKSAFRADNGYSADENLGLSVLVYDTEAVLIGCGILVPETQKKVLQAKIGTYPGYTGDLSVVGKVKVTFESIGSDKFFFSYDLKGLEVNCVDCGIHIHAGTSCATHEEVKGHGWNSVVVQDLWTRAGGAFYNSDSNGKAKGYFYSFNGFGYEENLGHAVVLHGQDGTRLGCGVLM